jgi:ABC-type thiamine transport system ATPase subunit
MKLVTYNLKICFHNDVCFSFIQAFLYTGMLYLQSKLHNTNWNTYLVITIKKKDIYRIHATEMLFQVF